jgi:four helix bundle protein
MHRLENLKVWLVANLLARSAYRLTMVQPLQRHFGLADQIRRAAVSIPANLAEGYGLGTTPQFIRCVRIALASAYELRVHLGIARDLGLAGKATTQVTLDQADETIRMLIGLLKSLQRR